MRRPKEQDDPKGIVILRVGEVCQRMSVSYVYGLIAHQLFPQFVPIGPKSCGLPEHVSRRLLRPRLSRRLGALLSALGVVLAECVWGVATKRGGYRGYSGCAYFAVVVHMRATSSRAWAPIALV